jgi:hypothetical protein
VDTLAGRSGVCETSAADAADRSGKGAVVDVKELLHETERVWAMIIEAGDEAMRGLAAFAHDVALAGLVFRRSVGFASATVGWFDVATQE